MSEVSQSQKRGDQFSFGPVEHVGDVIIARFECSAYGSFTERVEVGPGHVPEALLRLLQVALGVSSYKAAAAKAVVFPPLTPAGRAMAEALYTEGLAEFFVRASLLYPAGTLFSGDIVDTASTDAAVTNDAPLVAFGGGKDSYVAGRIAHRAFGAEPEFASVILSDAVGDTLQKTAPSALRLIKRHLDPKLLSLTGAFNGHVPITAINILVLTIVGLLERRGPVLFANERSADEPTMVLADGTAANHQYSKSSAFEELVRVAVAEAAPEAPATYSVLRPFSELWIGSQFANITSAFNRFTSCNKNFRLAGDATKRWCGTCAKCAFTSLILAPYIDADQGEQIFSRNMLDHPPLLTQYRDILGLTDQKPWDCVGTIVESQAALFLAGQSDAWRDSLAVRTLLPELTAMKSAEELERQASIAMTARERGALPKPLYDAAMELNA